MNNNRSEKAARDMAVASVGGLVRLMKKTDDGCAHTWRNYDYNSYSICGLICDTCEQTITMRKYPYVTCVKAMMLTHEYGLLMSGRKSEKKMSIGAKYLVVVSGDNMRISLDDVDGSLMEVSLKTFTDALSEGIFELNEMESIVSRVPTERLIVTKELLDTCSATGTAHDWDRNNRVDSDDGNSVTLHCPSCKYEVLVEKIVILALSEATISFVDSGGDLEDLGILMLEALSNISDKWSAK